MIRTITVALIVWSAVASASAQGPRLANPASEACVKQGGQVLIERNGAGEYGLCRFPDGKICEEWAMFRMECPAGGVDLSPYKTPAAKYCVARGGILAMEPGGDESRATCFLPESRSCPAADFFNGTCR